MLGVPSSWSSLTVADLVASSDNIDMRLIHMSSHFRTKVVMLVHYAPARVDLVEG